MTKTVNTLLGAALLAASTLTTAAAFDGSVPLLCAVTGTASCDSLGDCIEGPAEAVNLPVFLKIDVQNKVVQSVRAGGEQRTSEILRGRLGSGLAFCLFRPTHNTGTGQAGLVGGCENQVNMVRHRAVGPDLHAV